jgi:hypothetical protein
MTVDTTTLLIKAMAFLRHLLQKERFHTKEKFLKLKPALVIDTGEKFLAGVVDAVK